MKGDSVQQDSDAAEIVALIDREITAFFNRDFAGWAACYDQSDRLRSVMMSHELGLDVREGWEAAKESVLPHFTSETADQPSWRKTIEHLQVNGDSAWLTCRANTTSVTCRMHDTYETIVLERQGGDWKIVCANVLSSTSFEGKDQRIAVDAEGRVIGLTPRGRDRIAAHPGFALRAGRLRATDRRIDREMQAAFRRAGQLHGFFEQTAYAEIEGQLFAYPLVLERPDDAGHEVILLSVQDQLTYLDFGADAQLMSRVDVSAKIFGLSEGQHRVAIGVAEGRSLPEIAGAMGIRPATAKTHLQRIYQKTGTRTMTALVRTLLSVG